MTKHDFDAATKVNFGARCMASDERADYRALRHLPQLVLGRTPDYRDALAVRRSKVPAHLATLDIGSPMRAVARWRRNIGMSLLHERHGDCE